MKFRQAPLLLLTLLACTWLVASQNAPDEAQVSPNAQCKQEVRDKITSCLDQVEQDESKLKTGPCSSSDWKCICTKQQGMVDCYAKCPGLQPVDMIKFNGNNCKGQHGQTLKVEGGDLTYTWSTLPFTSASTEPSSITQSGDAAALANATSSAEESSGQGKHGTQSTDAESETDAQHASDSPTMANATAASSQISKQSSSAGGKDTSNTSNTSNTSTTTAATPSKDGAASILSTNGLACTGLVALIVSLLALHTL